MRLPLLGGSYQAQSIIANAQRCINLYPEANPKDSPVPLTHYQRPGFRKVAQGPVAPVRGLYRASNGNGYCCIGNHVYSISPSWVLTLLGTVTNGRTNPVSMIDNGTTMMVVDGSRSGWTVDLSNNAFAQIVDASGLFQGADKVDVIDTFMIWNDPETVDFKSTLSNVVQFDGLYFAGKSSYPDLLATLSVVRHQIYLLGTLKSEVWYDAGNVGFPFAQLPGAFIEHGTGAKYSAAHSDISLFWLGQDLEGHGIVFRTRGYECKRISTHAIEQIIQKYSRIDDAIGYTYQQNGHVFYVLVFPTGNATWVWDESTELWHQRCWTDPNGNLMRDRSNCGAFINGQNVVGDWQNGKLYALDREYFSDDDQSISYIRTFPHIGMGEDEQRRPIMADGLMIQHKSFSADIQCGLMELNSDGSEPQLTLRFSDDRGETFGPGQLQTFGKTGAKEGLLARPTWKSLGVAMDRVYELSWSVRGKTALNGAWCFGQVLKI